MTCHDQVMTVHDTVMTRDPCKVTHVKSGHEIL